MRMIQESSRVHALAPFRFDVTRVGASEKNNTGDRKTLTEFSENRVNRLI